MKLLSRLLTVAAAALMLVVTIAAPASAHRNDESYLYMDIGKDSLSGRVEMPYPDLRTVFGMDLSGSVEDIRAEIAANECDLMLAVGSTLSVYPIANVVPIAASHGAPVVIVNGDATQFDAIAEVVINGGISQTLPYLCRADIA